MNGAYGWAFARPVRKIFCNMTVTALSVVAVVIGLVELAGVVANPDRSRPRDPGLGGGARPPSSAR